MNVNPNTRVLFTARYTLAGGPGAYEGTAKWTSDSPKDMFENQQDDAAGGIAKVALNGSQHTNGETSTVTVSADVMGGEGDQQLAGTAEVITWSVASPVLADGVTMDVPIAPEINPLKGRSKR